MKIIKLIISFICLVNIQNIFANQIIAVDKIIENFNNGVNKFNPSLPNNSHVAPNGLFLYKLGSTNTKKLVPTYFLTTIHNVKQAHNFYGHLFGQILQHFFVDLAGGNDINADILSSTWKMPYYKNDNVYNKDWVASATALFAHTWKEFMFNANIGLTHTMIDKHELALNAIQPWAPVKQNHAYYTQENAELSYQINSTLRPFIDGGILQLLNFNNVIKPNWLSTLSNFDVNTYKIGGGIALNYKQYMVRLEQQYFQQGNAYLGNQSTISLKINLG